MNITKSVMHWVLTAISMTLAVLIFLISHERLWVEKLKSLGAENILNTPFFKFFDQNLLKIIFPYFIYISFLILLVLIGFVAQRFEMQSAPN